MGWDQRTMMPTYLGFQITMDVPQLVQLVHGHEHLANIESRNLLLENACVVEKCPEVASRYVFHRKIHVLWVLEGIKEANEPRGLRSRQDVTLNKDMPNLTNPVHER